jgi:hypothetical protein
LTGDDWESFLHHLGCLLERDNLPKTATGGHTYSFCSLGLSKLNKTSLSEELSLIPPEAILLYLFLVACIWFIEVERNTASMETQTIENSWKLWWTISACLSGCIRFLFQSIWILFIYSVLYTSGRMTEITAFSLQFTNVWCFWSFDIHYSS